MHEVGTVEGYNGITHFEGFYDDGKTELPPLPPDITSSVGYGMGGINGFYGDEFGYSEEKSVVEGGGHMGFDSVDYVHSPMFSTMPAVSDKAPEEFDLGSSSSYFF